MFKKCKLSMLALAVGSLLVLPVFGASAEEVKSNCYGGYYEFVIDDEPLPGTDGEEYGGRYLWLERVCDGEDDF